MLITIYKHLDQYRKRQIEVGHVVKEANQCVGHLASKGTVDSGAPNQSMFTCLVMKQSLTTKLVVT